MPGTTISLRISFPSTWARTRGSSFARAKSSALGEADRHLDLVAHPAVHLDDELERVALEQSRVGLGPGLLPQALTAEPLPELLGHVRRVRLDQADRGLGREAHLARPGRVVLHAVDLVDELDHGRDRRVELEPPEDVVGHLGDRFVRPA